MNLEICCYRIQDALAVQALGVDRIELCNNASVGGTTPPENWLAIAQEKITIPWYCMIRPRGGNFTYTTQEFEQLLQQVSLAKKYQAHGLVTGMLTAKNGIHWQQLQQAITAAGGTPITFHKAIDVQSRTPNTLQKLATYGVANLLTTAGYKHITQALEKLNNWRALPKTPTIIACGGVRSHHIQLLKNSNFQWLHAAPLKPKTNQLDLQEVEKMVNAIRKTKI